MIDARAGERLGRRGMVRTLMTLAGLATIAIAATPALADEAKAGVSASMLFRITRPPIEAREPASARWRKARGPPARPPLAEVLPDGSLKIDRAIITVRNPCPPGMMHADP